MSVCVNMVKNISDWINNIVVVFFLRNIRNAVSILEVSQAGNFLYPAVCTFCDSPSFLGKMNE